MAGGEAETLLFAGCIGGKVGCIEWGRRGLCKQWEETLHQDDVRAIACFGATNDAFIATGSFDNTAAVYRYNPAGGLGGLLQGAGVGVGGGNRTTPPPTNGLRMIARLTGHGDKVLGLCFNGEEAGREVITSSADGKVRCWRVREERR